MRCIQPVECSSKLRIHQQSKVSRPHFFSTRSETNPDTIPGVTYCFGGNVYVSLTNESNAQLTMLAANGPGFTFPPGTGFEPLPIGQEPTGKEAAEQALEECRRLDKEEGVKTGGREVVFAGLGEPLFRLPALLEALELLHGRHEVSGVRLNTNGLVRSGDAVSVAKKLKARGLASVCVQLQTSCPSQYRKLVQPKDGLGFDDACNFVRALAGAGFQVQCSVVANPSVDVDAARSLAINELGAETFQSRPYFP